MARKLHAFVVFTILTALPALLVFSGCNRNEQQPSQPQSGPPAMAVPQQSQAPAMTPAPQQQPVAPQTAAPQTTPATPMPQQQMTAPTPPPSPGLGNVSQVQLGMNSQQVLQLLGNPSKVKPKGQYVEWEYYTPQGKFEIKIQADQVVAIENH